MAPSKREEQDPDIPSEKVAWTLLTEAIKYENPDGIRDALQSKYRTIIKLAVSRKARWFYNGEYKNIVNEAYFRERIFPYVTPRTRGLIVKTLAQRSIDLEFAENMTEVIKSLYGIQEARPLLIACKANYSRFQVKKNIIALSCKFLTKAYQRNKESRKLVIDYLNSSMSPAISDRYKIDIRNYATFLPNLIKNDRKIFLKLYEEHAGILTGIDKTKEKKKAIVLSKELITVLLKKELKYMKKKPELFLNLLLHKFNKFNKFRKKQKDAIEDLLSSAMPEDYEHFDTDKIFKYIKYFPKEMQLKLLFRLYKNKYKHDFLNDESNITIEIMEILPHCLRKYIHIETHNLNLSDMSDYKTCLICYLPIDQSMKLIKSEFEGGKELQKQQQINLISKMIYTCKINDDYNTLRAILLWYEKYYENWYNELFEQLLQIYGSKFLEPISLILYNIIKKCYLRNKQVREDILVVNLLNTIPNKRRSLPVIRMLLNSTKKRCYFQFPKKCKQHEKMVLNISEDLVKERYISQDWEEYKDELVCYFVIAICDFNARSNQDDKISFSPWVKDKIICLIKQESQKNCIEKMKKILENKELKVYKDLLSQDIIANVMSGKSSKLVKKDVQNILRNSKNYYEAFRTHYRNKNVQRFLRALRGEKLISSALSNNWKEKIKNMTWTTNTADITIMTLLWDTSEVITFLRKIMTTDQLKIINESSEEFQKFEKGLATVIRLCKPPISFSFVADLPILRGHYFRIILNLLPSLINRSHPPDMIEFLRELIDEKTVDVDDSMRSRGINLISQLISTGEFFQILKQQWQIRSSGELRKTLNTQTRKLFNKNSNSITWHLYSTIIIALIVEEELSISELQEINNISYKYLDLYVELYLNTIDSLDAMDSFQGQITINYIDNLFDLFNSHITHGLSERVIGEIVGRFTFDTNLEIAGEAANFMLESYLFDDRLDERLEVFEQVLMKKIATIQETELGQDEEEQRSHRMAICNFVKFAVSLCSFPDRENTIINNNNRKIKRIHELLIRHIDRSIDEESYLLLKCVEIRQKCKRPFSFATKIRKELIKLTEPYPVIDLVVRVLHCYLQTNRFLNQTQENVYYDVIHGFGAYHVLACDLNLKEKEKTYCRNIASELMKLSLQ